MRAWLKTALFGRPGAYRIRRGLLRGLRFHVDPGHKSQRLLGMDEREVAPATRAFAARTRTAVDVGANDGWYTLYFASVPGVRRVIACEPDAASLVHLERNIGLNPPEVGRKIDVF